MEEKKDITTTQTGTGSQSNQDSFICSTPNCTKPSSMQCPTCLKLGIFSYFCSQECFKEFWPIHKLFHQKKPDPNENYTFTGTLRPGKQTPRRFVPDHIPKPDWHQTGYPSEEMENRKVNQIEVKTPQEIQNMREACLIGRKALDLGHSLVKPGITTDEIDRQVHEYIISQGAYPSPLNYHNFPKSLCTSINEIICHGIPDDRPLEEGDIINLDVSVYYKGMHADLNETYCVGKVDDDSLKLVSQLVDRANNQVMHTYKALEKVIEICKPGEMYKEIGNVIEKYVKEYGLSVVRTYTGHGVGKFFHCAPNVPHYSNNKTAGFMKVNIFFSSNLKAGHIFTIEPMINQGVWKDITWPDGWTSSTADGKRSAQFEHTILITETGCEVLTKRLESSPPLEFEMKTN